MKSILSSRRHVYVNKKQIFVVYEYLGLFFFKNYLDNFNYLYEVDGMFVYFDAVVGGGQGGGDGDAGRQQGEVWYPRPVLVIHMDLHIYFFTL